MGKYWANVENTRSIFLFIVVKVMHEDGKIFKEGLFLVQIETKNNRKIFQNMAQ